MELSKIKEPEKPIENIRNFLRPLKYALIDLFISLSRIFFCWVPGGDVGKGKALILFHALSTIYIYINYFALHSNKSLRLLICLFFVLIIFQQLMFRGCVITKAEQKLTGQNDTIFDSLIRIVGYEPTRELRLISSVGIFGAMTFTLLINTILDQFH